MKKMNSQSDPAPVCPVCKNATNEQLGEHIKKYHGETEFKKAVLRAKERGMPDQKIGTLYDINFRQLEKIVTEKYGINISILKKPKKARYFEPKDFNEETTTVWSFPQRGSWATHDSRYRGNWSPYIPRNVILKYSKPGETVLDYFVGGGTTAVEAKLLGRKCIASDINPAAVGLTRENLKFSVPERSAVHEPEVKVGDARDLKKLGIRDGKIDLICAHPPYAGIIEYGSKIEGDLSKLSVDEFLTDMGKVASESFRVLKPGGKCAILIGDTRKKKHVIPIGFKTINVFLNAGFKLKELVIKRQHNCKTTGFWHDKSVKYNFLLLAHEFLPIFEKPNPSTSSSVKKTSEQGGDVKWVTTKPTSEKVDELEAMTVWIFPEPDLEKRLNKNVLDRYLNKGKCLNIAFTSRKEKISVSKKREAGEIGLLYIKSPFLNDNPSREDIGFYLNELKEVVQRETPNVNKGGFLAIQTRDARISGYVEPLGKRILDTLVFDNLWLKEIVIVTPDEQAENTDGGNGELKTTHQYLLVYDVLK